MHWIIQTKRKILRPISINCTMLILHRVWTDRGRVCVYVYLPLGGGLMSVSPCWLELSDCPDSAKKQQKGVKSREI